MKRKLYIDSFISFQFFLLYGILKSIYKDGEILAQCNSVTFNALWGIWAFYIHIALKLKKRGGGNKSAIYTHFKK